ncbi:MAG TPA: MerR family transcriptional regulator [Clostridia bacterium]|nr:MerR family transcriptional regulator [Clostridia bacterium]
MKNTAAVSRYIRTSEIAKAVGVHPNTVRLYEELGFLQTVPRSIKGYRLYTKEHLEQMRLARIAMRCEFVEGNIRKRAASVVRTAAKGDLKEALQMAYGYLAHIRNERSKAEEALELSQKWISGEFPADSGVYYKRTDVARLLEVSIDVLRNWERNGLVNIPRSVNNYRAYGPVEISRLKIIRTLRAANYSMMAILRMMKYIDTGKKGDMRGVLNTPLPEEDVVGAADRWISALTETEEDAKEVILQLEKMIKINMEI